MACLRRMLAPVLAVLLGMQSPVSQAGPEGAAVISGQVSIQTAGPQTTIQASHNAQLNWNRFNIQQGETTTFIQPSRAAIVWNRILDQYPSQILGTLNANGYVVLMNQNGFFFGPKSVINVGGLIATTAPLRPAEGATGGLWQYDGPPPAADIIHYGQINAARGGSVFLIAEKIVNNGVIMAPDGNIGLYAGKEVLVSERPDGRGLSASVRLPTGAVDNYGKLVADAGQVALQARVVNQDGMVQANAVRERNGIIELVAAEAVNLGAHSTISTSGDQTGISAGGQVSIKSSGAINVHPEARLCIAGGSEGGNGGSVALCAPSLSSIEMKYDASAARGYRPGSLLVDPAKIVLGYSSSGSASDTLYVNVNTAFRSFSQIVLQATLDITLAAGVVWNLFNTTEVEAPGSTLTIQSGHNVVFSQGSGLVAGAGWSVAMVAGSDPAHPDQSVLGQGSIYLNGSATGTGNGYIQTQDGSLRLSAGADVMVGSGYIRSAGGGSITITTGSGDVKAGTKSTGLEFTRDGYQLSTLGVGGISTTAGGDVNITSGRDIISLQPTSGAYGAEPGNVTLTAHNRVLGSYLVRNGTGRITSVAGDVGTENDTVNLSLMSGGWEVYAPAGSIYLNEVRNPNGALNGNVLRRFNGRTLDSAERISQYFDYSLDAYVRLEAAYSVQLLGNKLTRPGEYVPPVYPPRLEITAGSGGVVLGNDVILYPSAQGDLRIVTQNGGGLRSREPGYYQMVMSDSGDLRYTTFALGHAATPLHLHDPNPVFLQINGDIHNVFVRAPKRSEIRVNGNTLNFSFEGMNLHPEEETLIAIAGDFNSRINRTYVTLAEDANLAVFDPLLTLNGSLGARLTYDPVTRRLGLQNRMTAADLNFLLHPVTYQVDELGRQVLDDNGVPVVVTAVFTADHAALQALYDNSQDIPASGLAYQGLQLGGQGRLKINARKMDLGISQGIRSIGRTLNPNLAGVADPLHAAGAAVLVEIENEVDMSSSQIASFGGGPISIKARGNINVGSQERFTSDDVPKGIYTSDGGDVSVESLEGDIGVNGSRIAAFNSGNVTVKAARDIDAGSGGLGAVVIYREIRDPVTGEIVPRPVTIGISGIAATLFPDTRGWLGNVVVEAGRDILANLGGVRQAAFGGSAPNRASVTLKAGRDINAGLSGIIGENVNLDAKGNISGLVVAKADLDIKSVQNVSVMAVAGASASVSAGGQVSGTIAAGAGGISVSADVITANLAAHNVSASGDTKTATMGVQTAGTPHTEKVTPNASETVATKVDADRDEEERKKRKGVLPTLAKYVGRVTVIFNKKQTQPHTL